jgi:Cadherin-like beta sandwich domain
VMAIGSATFPAGTASGSVLDIPLGGPGSDTLISIVVTAQNGVDSTTYTVTVHRAASDDSTLTVLVVTANSVAHPVDLNTPPPYTVNVATNITKVDVSATKSDPNAVMAIGSATFPAGTASGSVLDIPLGGPGSDTLISIVVTAQNGVDSTTYTVTVRRPLPSSDKNLFALSVSAGSLNPPFVDPNILDYMVDGATGVPSITVTATKSDPNATMSALGSVIAAPGTSTGEVTILTGTNTTVEITVIAQDGVSTNVYKITVP